MRFLPLSLFLVFIFSFLLPVAPTTTTTTIWQNALDKDSATWRNFAKFIDLQKGSEAAGVCDLKSYFKHFGYLPPSSENYTDVFDSSLETAIFDYQNNFRLPLTGKLDTRTLHLIMSPRCGMPDHSMHPSHDHETQHYAYFSGKPRWVRPMPTTLTYAFEEGHLVDYLSKEDIRAVFSRAFSRWSKVIPVNFTETQDYEAADVKIGFHKGDHGDGEPFDGVLGVLAHAFSPQSGRLHLDGAETWAVDFNEEKSRVAVDLESVATHEIGHILGLAHSSNEDAIMYPSLSPRSKKVDLRVDDVEGVQSLYGSNPDFKLNSFLESEERETSGSGSGSGGGHDSDTNTNTPTLFLTFILPFLLQFISHLSK